MALVKKNPPNINFFAWGENKFGQLGLGSPDPIVSLPRPVPFDMEPELEVDQIRAIQTGYANTFIVMKNGRVFGCGLNNLGQLGLNRSRFEERSFVALEFLSEFCVRSLSVMLDSCYALTEDDICIAWGSNTYGQLGENPSKIASAIIPIELFDRVKQVAAGYNFVILLTEHGEVISCGDGRYGQLGRGNDNYHWELGKVELEHTKAIAAGQYHGVALTESNRVYSWGANMFSQLGVGEGLEKLVSFPTEIHMPGPMEGKISIGCGWRHSAVLIHLTGQIIIWGDNSYSQFGSHGVDFGIRVISDLTVKKLAHGYGHIVTLVEKGVILCWGHNLSGSCGIGNTEEISFPLKTRSGIITEVQRIFAGYKQSFALGL